MFRKILTISVLCLLSSIDSMGMCRNVLTRIFSLHVYTKTSNNFKNYFTALGNRQVRVQQPQRLHLFDNRLHRLNTVFINFDNSNKILLPEGKGIEKIDSQKDLALNSSSSEFSFVHGVQNDYTMARSDSTETLQDWKLPEHLIPSAQAE